MFRHFTLILATPSKVPDGNPTFEMAIVGFSLPSVHAEALPDEERVICTLSAH